MLIISILLVVLYVGATIWVKKELPDSVSAMVYDFPKKWQIIWTIWMWAVTALFAPSLISALEGSDWQFVSFLAVACLIFTGGVPLVKNERNTAHNIYGILSGVFLQICAIKIYPYCILLWILWAAVLALVQQKWTEFWFRHIYNKGVFLIEKACYISTMCALIIKTLF